MLQRFLGADTKYQQPSMGSNGNNFSTQITMMTKCSPTTRRTSACQERLSSIWNPILPCLFGLIPKCWMCGSHTLLPYGWYWLLSILPSFLPERKGKSAMKTLPTGIITKKEHCNKVPLIRDGCSDSRVSDICMKASVTRKCIQMGSYCIVMLCWCRESTGKGYRQVMENQSSAK